jgi:hypothetical protein
MAICKKKEKRKNPKYLMILVCVCVFCRDFFGMITTGFCFLATKWQNFTPCQKI